MLKRKKQRLLFSLLMLLCFSGGTAWGGVADAVSDDPLATARRGFLAPKHKPVLTYGFAQLSRHDSKGRPIYDVQMRTGRTPDSADFVKSAQDYVTLGYNDSLYFPHRASVGAIAPHASMTLEDTFYDPDDTSYANLPQGLVCNAYFAVRYRSPSNHFGKPTCDNRILFELIEADRILGHVDLTDLLPRFIYNNNTKADVCVNLHAADWNQDGYSDYFLTYHHDPDTPNGNSYQGSSRIKVVSAYIDGRALYDAVVSGKSDALARGIAYTFGTELKVRSVVSIRSAIGDIDGDGSPELAVFHTSSQSNKDLNTLSVYKVEESASGFSISKKADTTQNTGKNSQAEDNVGIAVGDIDGDGVSEICAINTEKYNVYINLFTYNAHSGLQQKSGTTARLQTGLRRGASATGGGSEYFHPPMETVMADIDGDGRDDVIWLNVSRDDANKLALYVHRWPYTDKNQSGLPDKCTIERNLLNDIGANLNFDKDYLNYRLVSGYFDYSGYSSLDGASNPPAQLAIATAAYHASAPEVAVLTYSRDQTPNPFSVNLHKSKSNQSDNVLPNWRVQIAAADLDHESLVLGTPTPIRMVGNMKPLFILQAPPRHVDIIDEPFSGEIGKLPNGGYRANALFDLGGWQTSFNSETDTKAMRSTTKASSFKWGRKAAGSLSVTAPLEIVSALFEVGGHKADTNKETSESETTRTFSTSLATTAELDDQLAFVKQDYTIWRYPVLFPESERTEKSGDETIQRFLQYVVPNYRDGHNTAVSVLNGRAVDWYEPAHNNNNLFTYPRSKENIKGYPLGTRKPTDNMWHGIDGLLLASAGDINTGNQNPFSTAVTITDESKKKEISSITEKAGVSESANISVSIALLKSSLKFNSNQDWMWNTTTTSTTDASEMKGITVHWPGLQSPYVNSDGFRATDQAFTAEAAIFTQDDGTLVAGYAVPQMRNSSSGILWGKNSTYTRYPDPGLNLPYRLDLNGEPNTNKMEALKIRGMTFNINPELRYNALKDMGRAFPANTDVCGYLRIFNFSFKRSEACSARVLLQRAQQDEGGYLPDPDASLPENIQISEFSIPEIPGRDNSEGLDNWVDVAFDWRTQAEHGTAYLHVLIDYDRNGDRRELTADNNSGFVLVGFYTADYADMFARGAASSRSAERAAFLTEGSLDLRIDRFEVSDRFGNLYKPGAALPADEELTVRCVVALSAEGIPDMEGLPYINMEMYVNDELCAVREIPYLSMGGKYVFEGSYHPARDPEGDALTKLTLATHSQILHIFEDATPQNNTVEAHFERSAIGATSGGCAAAHAGAFALLPLALIFLATGKRVAGRDK